MDLVKIPDELICSADLNICGVNGATSTSTSVPSASSTSGAPHSSLAQLAEDSLFTDLTIEVGGERIPAHRAVLAARSPVLRAMLSADMREGREARIALEDVSFAAWRAFQIFLYTDGLAVPKSSDTGLLLEVLMLSDKYGVDPLKERVEAALIVRMTPENVVDMFEAVQSFQVSKMKDAASEMIVRNWSSLRKEKKVTQWMTSGSELAVALLKKLHF